MSDDTPSLKADLNCAPASIKPKPVVHYPSIWHMLSAGPYRADQSVCGRSVSSDP